MYKGYRSKQLKDVSNYLMMFIGAGAILWVVYGVLVSDVYIIGTNSAAVVLMIIVLAMKKKYDNQLKIAKIDNVSRGIDKLQVRTATVQQRISQNNERSFLIAVLRGGGGRFDKSIMFCLRFNSNHCL